MKYYQAAAEYLLYLMHSEEFIISYRRECVHDAMNNLYASYLRDKITTSLHLY